MKRQIHIEYRPMMNVPHSHSIITVKKIFVCVVLLATWLTCQPLFAVSFANYGQIMFPEGVVPGTALWTWSETAPMPTARLGLAACTVNGNIYVIGGYPSANIAGLTTVEKYDPTTNTWTTKAPMPTRRRWLSASAVDGKIYAIGGFETLGTPALPIVEEYNVATDTWTAKAPMQIARKGFSTAVLDGKIYAFGGANANEQRTASVEMYDPTTDSWSPRASMLTARAMLTTSVVNGKIYAIGGPWPGDAGIAAVEEYDPISDTWTTKASMPTRRWGLTAETLGGKIYAMGGAQGTSGLSVVDVYDPATDTWTVGPDMSFLSWGLASTVVDNGIYVMGGASTGPPHPGTDTMLAYTSSVTDLFPKEGPLPVEFGLPTPTDSPLSGWDENAVVTITSNGTGGSVTLDAATLMATIPFDNILTHIAYDDMGNELGRLVLRAIGEHQLDLNADHAIVDEAAGTILVDFDGNLMDGQPLATFSVVKATGIYVSDASISHSDLLWYVGGYVGYRLISSNEDDPSESACLCPQDSLLKAFSLNLIVDMDIHCLWTGNLY